MHYQPSPQARSEKSIGVWAVDTRLSPLVGPGHKAIIAREGKIIAQIGGLNVPTHPWSGKVGNHILNELDRATVTVSTKCRGLAHIQWSSLWVGIWRAGQDSSLHVPSLYQTLSRTWIHLPLLSAATPPAPELLVWNSPGNSSWRDYGGESITCH